MRECIGMNRNGGRVVDGEHGRVEGVEVRKKWRKIKERKLLEGQNERGEKKEDKESRKREKD